MVKGFIGHKMKIRLASFSCKLKSLKAILPFFKRFYLFIHERHKEREAEIQAEGEAGSRQGARHETQSQVSRIMPWNKGRCSTAEPSRCPQIEVFLTIYLMHLM